jgi:transcriptional regulator with XRE-family HTH domain
MVISVHHARYARIRTALKQARKEAGLSQVDLAKLLYMEQSNLSKIERGERYIDVFFFIDYCRACNVDPAAILKQIETSI